MTLITFKDGKPVMRDGLIGTEQQCCCVANQPCSCESAEPKLWVTFNGEKKGLTVCDMKQWVFCSSWTPFLTGENLATVTTEYAPAPPSTPTVLRVTITSGYGSYGNCGVGTTTIGAGTDWVYEYELDANNCPTGSPTLISETSHDNTDLCDDPAACCDETCFGTIYTPTLSLTP